MVTQTLKVEFELLEESDDPSVGFIHEGRRFTGVAYERDAAGRLVSLSGYRDGQACGPLRTWYPSGQIEQEQYYRAGRQHGPCREWHPSGRPRLDAYYEQGRLLRSRRWGEDGALVETARVADRPCHLSDRAGDHTDRKNHLLDIDPSTWELVERPIAWGRDPSELPDGAALSARAP